MAFEEHLQRLETIVGQLDGDTLDLAQALALFQEGVDLLQRAAEELRGAEAQVKRLVEQGDGTLTTTDFHA